MSNVANDNKRGMASTNWADEEEEGDFPQMQVEFDKAKGVKRETEYQSNDEGDLVKVVREYKVQTVTVSVAAAKRKQWRKFGAAKNDPPGPNASNTYPGEQVVMKFINDKELEEGDGDEDGLSKLKNTDQALKCRTCGGAHFSHKCPYKDELATIKEISQRLDGTGAVGADGAQETDKQEAEPLSRGRSTGAYIPPSMRGKGGPGESMTDRRRLEDQYTVRVTNLPEDTKDQDLNDLFHPFGRIQRVYLAKDKVTNFNKGFAFVTFTTREDAARAIAGVHGFGYDHLILRVEWARPSTNAT